MRAAKLRLDPAVQGPPPQAYVTTMLKQCHTANDVLEVYEHETEAFDAFNYGAAGARMLTLLKSKAAHKREQLPRSRVVRFLAGMVECLEASPAAPPIGVVANLARTAAELGLDDKSFWQRLTAAAIPQIATAAKPKDIAMLAAGMAKAGVRDAGLVKELGDRFASSPTRYTVLEAQMLSASLADVEIHHAAALNAAERIMVNEAHRLLSLSRPKPTEMRVAAAAVSQAYRLGRLASPVFDAFQPFFLAHAKRMQTHDLASTASAYSQTGRLTFLPVIRECLQRLTHPQRLEEATPTDLAVAARSMTSTLAGARAFAAAHAAVFAGAAGDMAEVTRHILQQAADTDAETDAESGLRRAGAKDKDKAKAKSQAAFAARQSADARAVATRNASAYLDTDGVMKALSWGMVRHIDPAAAGRDPLALAVADAASADGRAGPYHRHPTVKPSAVHCLHVLEAERDSGAALSMEARAKITDRLAETVNGLRPTEAVRAMRLLVASSPPKRLAGAVRGLIRSARQSQWRAFDADPVSAAAAATALVSLAGQPGVAASLTSRLVPRDRSVEPTLPSRAEALDAQQDVDPVRIAAGRAADRAVRSAAVRSSALTAKQRASLAWVAGTARQPHPEALGMAAAELSALLQAHATASLIAPPCVALAASAHPAWLGGGEGRLTCPLGGGTAERSVAAAGLVSVGRASGSEEADWLLGAEAGGAAASRAEGASSDDDDAGSDGSRDAAGVAAQEMGLEAGEEASTSRGAERRARVTADAMTRHAAALLGADGEVKSLRPAASRWLRRAVRRGRLSAMPAAAIAWALVAGAPAGEAKLAMSEDELIQALLLGCEGSGRASVPRQAGPGEVALAAEAAVLLGGAPLLLRAREEVPWLAPLLGARQGSVELLRAPLGSGSLRQQPLSRYVSSVLGSGAWQEDLPARLGALTTALRGLGWDMRVGERLGDSFMTDLTLVRADGGARRHPRAEECAAEGSLVAVVCETPRVFWADSRYGLLPGERSRREALRELCQGTPLVRTDLARLAGVGTEAAMSVEQAALSLAAAADTSLAHRSGLDEGGRS